MVALGGFGVSAQKVQLCAVGENDRVALELHPGHFLHELHNVVAEDVRLGLTRAHEDLVLAGLHGIGNRFTGEVPRRPDLAAFEQVTNALMLPCPVPAPLVIEQRGLEGLDNLNHPLIAHIITGGLLLRPFVAALDVGVQVGFLPAALVLMHPG